MWTLLPSLSSCTWGNAVILFFPQFFYQWGLSLSALQRLLQQFNNWINKFKPSRSSVFLVVYKVLFGIYSVLRKELLRFSFPLSRVGVFERVWKIVPILELLPLLCRWVVYFCCFDVIVALHSTWNLFSANGYLHFYLVVGSLLLLCSRVRSITPFSWDPFLICEMLYSGTNIENLILEFSCLFMS